MHPSWYALVLLSLAATAWAAQAGNNDKVVLVIHGGAGAPDKATPQLLAEHRAELEHALRAGHAALGKSSLDAVEAAIKLMEDSPHFNAGKGAVYNREGRHELNASMMEGKERRAGALAGVCRIKNPISAARAIMEQSPHVFLIGDGAERFAREQKLEMVNPMYFHTERRWQELLKAQARHQADKEEARLPPDPREGFGTVGAVAVDRDGNIAAGTSTGGRTYVYAGRVGDSPIIGAGTYAENEACGISCTGYGELFIRYTVAADIAARVKYRKDPLARAVRSVLDDLPKMKGGVGGIIALDRNGNVAMEYNTAAMYRGTITSGGKVFVATNE